ncbi:MAG: hypothetical protein COU11_02150 [Candidatus Harrisonbacteria bacterium CG10_big_fil_rev_8_21_14_0_10_49_15]|uniref:Uncharacterized protein n=1 Tax=Candidatus Harrisonbacteria bacterium CG10_big_fil_rev_8_21_14_0_10_49_15 TaxID=1974587 RepID=A0A2H0UKT9_9BACT|nr:MAG: hypothetical protein COU11_02150 [Candidatus Harrisonbacteria bacterium CG10_big_fil_rev_8_21_14_0_10_49_15]
MNGKWHPLATHGAAVAMAILVALSIQYARRQTTQDAEPTTLVENFMAYQATALDVQLHVVTLPKQHRQTGLHTFLAEYRGTGEKHQVVTFAPEGVKFVNQVVTVTQYMYADGDTVHYFK